MKRKCITISKDQARILALAGQGFLLKNPPAKPLGVIEHLSYVQLDTLAVVTRAHHHTLWSRLPCYKETMLSNLLEKEKKVFEYWSHAASIIPMSHYRYSLPKKQSYLNGKSHWFKVDKKMKKYVLDRISAEGELQSSDFEYKRSGSGNWFEWKPAKQALEQLFMEGQLMVSKRNGFQKVYDITERVLPSHVESSIPSPEEFASYLIDTSIKAHGLVDEKEIIYIRKGLKDSVRKELLYKINQEEVIEVKVEGIHDTIYVTTKKQIEESLKINLEKNLHLLSPFDNLVIQRNRIRRLFDFDYTVECYVPEAKRQFGYFCLPVLYGDKFVARIDVKADRASKIFYLRSVHFEKSFKPDDQFNNLFLSKLLAFSRYNACEGVVIETAEKKWKKEFTGLLSAHP